MVHVDRILVLSLFYESKWQNFRSGASAMEGRCKSQVQSPCSTSESESEDSSDSESDGSSSDDNDGNKPSAENNVKLKREEEVVESKQVSLFVVITA